MGGSRYRVLFMAVSMVPVAMCFDLNGGLFNFGFTKSTLRQEFKGRPDYITGRILVGHRQTAPKLM